MSPATYSYSGKMQLEKPVVPLFRQMAESLEAFSTNHADMFEGAEGMDVEDGEHRYAACFTYIFVFT